MPQRTELVIDRLEGRVIAGDSVGRFVPMATPAEVASRYLALVKALRVDGPADDPAVVALRANDIAVLAEALFCSELDVRELLSEVLTEKASSIGEMSARSAKRPFMPGLGLLVAFTSLGGLLLVSSSTAAVAGPTTLPSGAVVRSTTVPRGVEIGTALVLERAETDPSPSARTDPAERRPDPSALARVCARAAGRGATPRSTGRRQAPGVRLRATARPGRSAP